jgi:hypothetical protein
MDSRLSGHQNQFEPIEEEKNLLSLPVDPTLIVQPIACCYTNWAILIKL